MNKLRESLNEHYWLFPSFLAVALSLYVTFTNPFPIGWDITRFHFIVARAWANGENGFFNSLVLGANRMPYPPFFHWLLVPSFWLSMEVAWAKILQILFLPLTILGFSYIMKAYVNKKSSFLFGMLLLGSSAFYDLSLQARPESFAVLFFPLVLLGILQNLDEDFAVFGAAMIWIHGLYSMMFLFGVSVWQFFHSRFKAVAFLVLLSSPIIALTFWYLPGGIANWSGQTATLQELWFYQNPIRFSISYLKLPFLALIFLPYLILHFKEEELLTKLMLLSLTSILPMLILVPDRFLQYASLPLSYVLGIMGIKNKWAFIVLTVISALFFIDQFFATYYSFSP